MVFRDVQGMYVVVGVASSNEGNTVGGGGNEDARDRYSVWERMTLQEI